MFDLHFVESWFEQNVHRTFIINKHAFEFVASHYGSYYQSVAMGMIEALCIFLGESDWGHSIFLGLVDNVASHWRVLCFPLIVPLCISSVAPDGGPLMIVSISWISLPLAIWAWLLCLESHRVLFFVFPSPMCLVLLSHRIPVRRGRPTRILIMLILPRGVWVTSMWGSRGVPTFPGVMTVEGMVGAILFPC